MYRPNTLKQRLNDGLPAFGLVHALGHSGVAEMMGLAGFDFVLIDGEHGSGDHQVHLHCLQALAGTKAHALFRLESSDIVVIKRALDLGPEGIMVPNVGTAEQAKAVVAGCRYPPRGVRGFAGTGVRASDYGFQARRYLDEYESRLLIAVMIESVAGVRNAAAIAEVDGVDLIQVGAHDLSYDLGHAGELEHPRVSEAIAHIERATLEAGKWLGGAPTPQYDAQALVERGYRLITVGRDISLFAGSMSAKLDTLRHLR